MTPEAIQSLIDDAVKLYSIHVTHDTKRPEFNEQLDEACEKIGRFYEKHWHTFSYISDYLDIKNEVKR